LQKLDQQSKDSIRAVECRKRDAEVLIEVKWQFDGLGACDEELSPQLVDTVFMIFLP
jgi:hypothetical protein